MEQKIGMSTRNISKNLMPQIYGILAGGKNRKQRLYKNKENAYLEEKGLDGNRLKLHRRQNLL